MINRLLNTVYIIITTGPLLIGVAYSLTYSLGLVGSLNTGFTLEHWQNLIADWHVWKSMLFSFWVAFVTLFISTLLALATTLYFKKKQSDRLLLIPLTIPPIVAAFFGFMLLSNGGMISRIAFALGFLQEIQEFPILIFDSYGIGIILTHTMLLFPFLALYFLNIYRKEEIEKLRELSLQFGTPPAQFIQKIYVPIVLIRARPVLVLFLLFVFGSYEIPLVIGAQNPQIISLDIIDKVRRFNLETIPLGHAEAVLFTLVVLGLTSILLTRKKGSYA